MGGGDRGSTNHHCHRRCRLLREVLLQVRGGGALSISSASIAAAADHSHNSHAHGDDVKVVWLGTTLDGQTISVKKYRIRLSVSTRPRSLEVHSIPVTRGNHGMEIFHSTPPWNMEYSRGVWNRFLRRICPNS
jgi:hypothetical protein